MKPALPAADLTHALDHSREVWNELKDARIFLTGASGFVGSWMLDTYLHAREQLGITTQATALVRDRDAFVARFPHFANAPGLRIHVGDVRVVNPPKHAYSHFVHCASAAPAKMNAEHPDEVVNIIEKGTDRMIDEARTGKGIRFLQVSSGSVYGPQPSAVSHIDESYPAAADPADPSQRFGAAKRRAEQMGEAAAEKGVGFVSARMFAVVGPRLPLDGQFAIGNFLADALAGRPVAINGDGSPVRAWIYAADMAVWCWTLLVRGAGGGAYNVGSEEELSLQQAAACVAALPSPPVAVVRARDPDPIATPSRYVPSTRLAREAFGLDAWIGFDEALRRTWAWLKS